MTKWVCQCHVLVQPSPARHHHTAAFFWSFSGVFISPPARCSSSGLTRQPAAADNKFPLCGSGLAKNSLQHTGEGPGQEGREGDGRGRDWTPSERRRRRRQRRPINQSPTEQNLTHREAARSVWRHRGWVRLQQQAMWLPEIRHLPPCLFLAGCRVRAPAPRLLSGHLPRSIANMWSYSRPRSHFPLIPLPL